MGQVTSVAIAGGGTGGHLIPGLAVARALQAQGVERIVFIGTARGLETRLVPPAGFPLELIAVGGLKNKSWFNRLHTLLQLPRSVAESRRILQRHEADAVLGIGGYASGPALVAARLLRIPIVLLEVNVKTGLANRLAARWALAAAVNFAETARDFRHATVTGIPVREDFFRLPPIFPEHPSLLIFGGSQGARALNRVMPEAAALWQRRGFFPRIVHQTGVADLESVRAAYCAVGVEAETHPFIEDMAGAMAEASLVVSRSGASTLGELAAAGRPAILVPLPSAADQHQLRNAEAFARAQAALVIEQSELDPDRLAGAVEQLLHSPPRLAAMGAAARPLARPGAADVIAAIVAGVPVPEANAWR